MNDSRSIKFLIFNFCCFTEKEIENQSNDDSQCLPDDPLIDEIAPQPNEVEPHPHQSPRKKKARVENDGIYLS